MLKGVRRQKMDMVAMLNGLNEETRVLLTLSIILFSGFIMTRMTNTLNMPKVSGYILAGILIGPCGLNFIPENMIDGMSFVSDLALAFIAFGVGKFFKKEVLMRTGKRIIIITISEALAAGILVTFLLKFMFHLNWDFALMLGAIATATAPASTMMTINQYKAKGEFVDTLLQIVALDDVVCLLSFSIVSAIVNGNAAGSLSAGDILVPVAYNILVIGLGVFCGYFLSRLLIPARSRDNRLILAIAMLLGLSGICAAIDISPLLSCMVFGAFYINLTEDKKLFRQINSFTPPVMSIFFIVSGMNLDIGALSTVGAIGVCYFVIRIIGKYLGTYISCMAMKTSREIRNYMGFALIPQAGVAIGLAFLAQRMLPAETGNLLLTIILSSSVLYEMVGPVSAKTALFLSGSISREKEGKPEPEGMEASSAAWGGQQGEEKAERVTAEPSDFSGGEIAKNEKEKDGNGGSLNDCVQGGSQNGEEGDITDEADDGGADTEELHAVLPELAEYSMGASESDAFNMEKEVEPRGDETAGDNAEEDITWGGSSHGKEEKASRDKKKKKGKRRNSRK